MAELKSVIPIKNVCKYFTLLKSTVKHHFQKTKVWYKKKKRYEWEVNLTAFTFQLTFGLLLLDQGGGTSFIITIIVSSGSSILKGVRGWPERRRAKKVRVNGSYGLGYQLLRREVSSVVGGVRKRVLGDGRKWVFFHWWGVCARANEKE